MKKPESSIVILTRNAGNRFKKTLDGVFSQKYKNFEVIIIDSSSSDNTLDIARKYPLKIIKISQKEFGHGKTRNLGAKLAKGKYVVYLTQDAIPKDENWLSNLVNNFNDKNVAGAYGRQIPYKDTNLLEIFSYSQDYPNKKIVWMDNNFNQDSVIFSDVNSAIRASILKKEMFAREILVSEDNEWAYRMLRRGYKIIYEPKARVIHSHNHNLIEVFRRFFDMGISHNQIHKNYQTSTLLKHGTKRYLEKLNWLLKERHFFLVFYAIFLDFFKFIAITLGKNEKLLPIFIKKKFSNYKYYWDQK